MTLMGMLKIVNKNIPVSLAGSFLCSLLDLHEKITTTDIMTAIRSKPPIPRIRIKIKCFPPFAALDEVGVEGRWNGAALGDISSTGAVIICTINYQIHITFSMGISLTVYT